MNDSSRRCSTCGTNWPNFKQYEICPDCKGETWVNISDPPDMSQIEAALALRDAFTPPPPKRKRSAMRQRIENKWLNDLRRDLNDWMALTAEDLFRLLHSSR